MLTRTSRAFVLGVLAAQLTASCAFDPDTRKTLRAATFEVLAPIPGSRSRGVVGTAFAIGPNEYVATAHTFDQIIGGRFERPVLMDSSRRGYELADILQYAQAEDFVVFSLRTPPAVVPLEISRDGAPGAIVYFAGRSLFGGITLRKGRYRGRSPEPESGGWNWIRFSSHVWNGLSGSALLDEDAKVIGIVSARSPVREPNYATPIELVPTVPPPFARIHSRTLLAPLGIRDFDAPPFDAQIFPLPMPYDTFAQELQRLRAEYFEHAVGQLLEATREAFALRGPGAAGLCELLNGSSCQCVRSAKGIVRVDVPTADALARRAKSGARVMEVLAGAIIVRTRGPRGATPRELSGNPQLHFTLASKGRSHPDLMLTHAARSALPEPADLEEVFTDFRGRSWQLRTWPLVDENLKLVSLARELPDGYVVLMRTVPTAVSGASILQLQFVANLVNYECADGATLPVDTLPRQRYD